MGFGDLFIAATLGALLASDRRLQLRGALLAAVICPAFDLLFFWVDQTPATVPIALTLACLELSQPYLAQRPAIGVDAPRDHEHQAQQSPHDGRVSNVTPTTAAPAIPTITTHRIPPPR